MNYFYLKIISKIFLCLFTNMNTIKELDSIIKVLCKKHKIKILPVRFTTPVGRCWYGIREVKIPRITSIQHFMVALHEIGHLVEGHSNKTYIDEYYAEMFALKTATKYGIDYKNYRNNAIGYVLYHISLYHNKNNYFTNIKDIPKKIIEFIKPLESDLNSWNGFDVQIYDWDKKRKNADIIKTIPA